MLTECEEAEVRRAFGAIGDAAMPARMFDELQLPGPSEVGEGRRRRLPQASGRTWIGGVIAVGIVVTLLVVGISMGSGNSDPAEQDVVAVAPGQPSPDNDASSLESPVSPGRAKRAGPWSQVAVPPLSARNNALVVAAGSEVLVLGGDNFLCSATSSCAEPDVVFADGAAYGPGTDLWRPLADAPLPFSALSASATVADGMVYVVLRAPTGKLSAMSYSVEEDRWRSLPDLPVSTSRARYGTVSGRGTVIAYRTSGSPDGAPDLLYDDETRSWVELPDARSGASSVRSMVSNGEFVYLFEKRDPSSDGSDPGFVTAARLNLGLAWEPLGVSEFLGAGPVLAVDSLFVNPVLGCSEGGTGVCQPFGWVYDIATNAWMSLPSPPTENAPSAGAIGDDTGLFFTVRGGLLLDVDTGEWIDMPSLGESTDTQRQVWAIGADAFAFGGTSFDREPDGELLTDAWIWRSERTQAAE